MHLVDTDVVSEPLKKNPDREVMAWLTRQSTLKVSAVSIMEIEFGVLRAPVARRAPLTEWLEALLSSPAYEVVPIEVATARAAARLKLRAEQAGRPRPWADLLIAASGVVSGSVVVTRNTSDFEGLGVPLLNPFGD